MENSDLFMQYSPLLAVVMIYFLQLKIFVTPQEMERKHREILAEVEKRFASKVLVDDVKCEITEIKEKIDKIYNWFLKKFDG